MLSDNSHKLDPVERDVRPLTSVPPEDRLTLAEAAELLGKSLKAVQQADSQGRIPVVLEPFNPDDPKTRHRVYTSKALLMESEYGRSNIRRQERRAAAPKPAEARAQIPGSSNIGSQGYEARIRKLNDDLLWARIRIAQLEHEMRAHGIEPPDPHNSVVSP